MAKKQDQTGTLRQTPGRVQTSPLQKTSQSKRRTNSTPWRSTLNQRTGLREQTTLFAGVGTDDSAKRSSPPIISPTISGGLFAKATKGSTQIQVYETKEATKAERAYLERWQAR